MKKNFKKISFVLFVLLLFVTLSGSPMISLAQTSSPSPVSSPIRTSTPSASPQPTSVLGYGWVRCDGVVTRDAKGVALEPGRTTECTFANLIAMVNYLINWLFGISIPIIIGLLVYSGFLYMTGKEANIKRAYKIMQQAVLGFVIMLLAWFIVTTILKWILKPWATNVTGTLIETQK